MPTRNQELGLWGERLVAREIACPRCKKLYTLRRLPPNFKCADVVCDFCGYLAQVKTVRVPNTSRLPARVLGAAWQPQRERMKAGIYFPLFLVLRAEKDWAVHYLAAEFQLPKLFRKRPPLSRTAKRAGWQGFYYDIGSLRKEVFIRIHDAKGASLR